MDNVMRKLTPLLSNRHLMGMWVCDTPQGSQNIDLLGKS